MKTIPRFRRLAKMTPNLLGGFCLGLLLPSASVAAPQEAETATPAVEQAEAPESIDTSQAYRLRPDEVSNYSIVQSFFLRAHHMSQARHGDRLAAQLLQELGIPADGEAAGFFAEKVEDGMEIIQTKTADFELEGEAFARYQFDALTTKADLLGAHFRALLDGLAKRGIDNSGILEYCEERIRPSISVTTTDPIGDADFWVAVSAFDRHLVGLEKVGP